MEKIIPFLIKAKQNTYANSNSKRIAASRLGSYDLQYEGSIDGIPAIYHDTYFGGENFIGEEIVYLNGIPIWGMNYYGHAVDSQFYEEAITLVLRPALMLVGKDGNLPLRGPTRMEHSDYLYTFNSTGTMEYFSGIEQILKKHKLIYELKCFGAK